MIYRILAAIAFIAVVVSSILFSGQQRESATPTTVTEPLRDPGYAARNATLIQTGPDGHPLYTLNADVIRQLPDQGTVQLDVVRLGFRDAARNQWTARADHGEVGENTGKVQLTGDVHVNGLLPGTQDPAEIATQHLFVDTQADVVSTKDPVTLSVSKQRLRARGLQATLSDGRVRLESDVHGTYAP